MKNEYNKIISSAAERLFSDLEVDEALIENYYDDLFEGIEDYIGLGTLTSSFKSVLKDCIGSDDSVIIDLATSDIVIPVLEQAKNCIDDESEGLSESTNRKRVPAGTSKLKESFIDGQEYEFDEDGWDGEDESFGELHADNDFDSNICKYDDWINENCDEESEEDYESEEIDDYDDWIAEYGKHNDEIESDDLPDFGTDIDDGVELDFEDEEPEEDDFEM